MKNGLILLLLGTAAMTWGAEVRGVPGAVALHAALSARPTPCLSMIRVGPVYALHIFTPASPCRPLVLPPSLRRF